LLKVYLFVLDCTMKKTHTFPTVFPSFNCGMMVSQDVSLIVQLSRELTATLCRKRPSPLERSKATVWACGIIHALGMVNFLFDSSQTPHIAVSQIWEYFKLRSSTMQAKSKQIRDLLGMYPMDPDWSTPSMADQNPLIWMRRLLMD